MGETLNVEALNTARDLADSGGARLHDNPARELAQTYALISIAESLATIEGHLDDIRSHMNKPQE